MGKQKTKVTTIREVDTEPGISAHYNPFIRRWLDNDLPLAEYEGELSDLAWRIWVQQIHENGRRQTVGRIYDNLYTLAGDLAAAFGDGHFKLMINYETPSNEKGFCRVENFETVSEADDGAGEGTVDQAAQVQAQLLMQREAQAHELRMKELDNQKAMMVAALTAKTNGPGLRVADFLSLFKAGYAAGEGRSLGEETDEETGEEKNDPVMQGLKELGVKILGDQVTRALAQPVEGPAPKSNGADGQK